MISSYLRRSFSSQRRMTNSHPELVSKYVDLRSDTVTRPCQKMRDAMSKAIVGDDVYKDCPTTNKIEKMVAEELGKEAALMTPTGT